MAIHNLKLSRISKLKPVMSDYIQGDLKLSGTFPVPSSSSIKEKTTVFSGLKMDRRDLVNVVAAQYGELVVPESLNELLDPNSRTITTGHQLCLFGGPQFFIHKIVSTIKLAQQYSEEVEINIVPVFWMASEDHDYDEINAVSVFNKKISSPKDAKGPVGRLSAEHFSDELKELEEILGDSEVGLKVSQLFKQSHSTGSLADATRSFVHEIFGKYGLIIIDGDDSRLKRAFSPFIKDELLGENVSAINQSIVDLKSCNYHVQVNPRPINLFYIEDGLRERIVNEGEVYSVLNTNLRFSRSEILNLVEESPEKFSPNAMLRPMYQEFLLPNIAYVGGAGELSYWFELDRLFQRNDVDFPLLVLRDSFSYLNTKELNLLESKSIELVDLFIDQELVQKQIGESLSEINLSENLLKQELYKIKEQIKKEGLKIGNAIEPMIEAEFRKIEKQLENLTKKIQKQGRAKNETEVNKVLRVRSRLLKGNTPAERVDGVPELLFKYGYEIIDVLLEASDPLSYELKVLIN